MSGTHDTINGHSPFPFHPAFSHALPSLCCWIFKFWHKQTQNAWTRQERTTWETVTTSPFLLGEKPQRHALCCACQVNSCTGMYAGSYQMRSQSGSLNELSRVCVNCALMDREEAVSRVAGGASFWSALWLCLPAAPCSRSSTMQVARLCFSERHR